MEGGHTPRSAGEGAVVGTRRPGGGGGTRGGIWAEVEMAFGRPGKLGEGGGGHPPGGRRGGRRRDSAARGGGRQEGGPPRLPQAGTECPAAGAIQLCKSKSGRRD